MRTCSFVSDKGWLGAIFVTIQPPYCCTLATSRNGKDGVPNKSDYEEVYGNTFALHTIANRHILVI